MPKIAYGVTLQMSTTSGGTYADIVTGLLSVKPASIEVSKVDITHLASTGRIKSRMPGWVTFGDVECEALYLDTEYDTVRDLALAFTENWFKFNGPGDSSTDAFQGFVSKVQEGEAGVSDEPLKFTFTLSPVAGAVYTP